MGCLRSCPPLFVFCEHNFEYIYVCTLPMSVLYIHCCYHLSRCCQSKVANATEFLVTYNNIFSIFFPYSIQSFHMLDQLEYNVYFSLPLIKPDEPLEPFTLEVIALPLAGYSNTSGSNQKNK